MREAQSCGIRVKPVIWMGGSREDVKRFPEAAQDSLGIELYRVQCGLDPKDWKPMTSVGPGVKEIRIMRVKKVAKMEHGPRHVTLAGSSVLYDLFPAEKAAEMEMRAQLLMGLEHWLGKSRMKQAEAAKVLGVTQARVSDLKRGKIDRFSMDLLVRLAARAGLKPKLKLAA